MVLKTREKVFIGVAVLVGVVMGFDQFVTQPKKKEAAALQKQVQEYNEKLASVTTSLTGLNPIRKRVEEKRKEKESMTGRISDDRQLGLLLDQLGKESQQKQMDLIQLNINDETAGISAEDKSKPKSGAFKKVILETGLKAGYGTIGPYLDIIQSLPIFMEVEKVDIQRKEESFPKLEINVQQVLYIASSPKKEAQGQGNGQPIQTLR
jgi:Tfp pilus assembly protein PilO